MNTLQSIIVVAALLTITYDWTRYWVFKKKLIKPFRRIILEKQEIIVEYKPISILYASYKRLPPEIYKIVKLNLKSMELKTPILQIVELFIKLILTIGVAFITFTLSMSGTLLNLAKIRDNTEMELLEKWLKIAIKLIETLQSGLDAYWTSFIIGGCLFIVASSHLLLIFLKEQELKKHLTVIEEIESEQV